MPKYTRYSAAFADEDWDAVVIGSGPGSLTAAALLAEAGQRVLVLERHYEPGGFSHTFKRREYEFDVGVHYVGAVTHEQSAERKIFDHVTAGELQWASMGDPYDVALVDGERYEFAGGMDNQKAMLLSKFPEEEQAIHRFYALVREAAKSAGPFFAERAMPSLASGVMGGIMRRKFLQFSDRTAYDVLRELTDNETLITVLGWLCGDYGLPPNEASFAIHAMVVHHYRGGAAYPVGGAGSIHRGIANRIESFGGTVAVKAPVEEIVVSNNRAVGVRLENGGVVRAKRVVSGAGARNTFGRLLPKAVDSLAGIRADLANLKPSVAHLCLYLGLNKGSHELGLPKCNYWVYDAYVGNGRPGGRLPTAYISFPSAKDPHWQAKHPNAATMQLIGLGRYEDVAQWADTKWRQRGEDYEAYKDRFKSLMLEKLFALHPETRGCIDWAEVSTPLSTAHFANYPSGEIYGLEHTPKRFRCKWLRPRTPIKNLYLTGQDIVTCGVGGALFSGVLTASAVLNKNVLGAIVKT